MFMRLLMLAICLCFMGCSGAEPKTKVAYVGKPAPRINLSNSLMQPKSLAFADDAVVEETMTMQPTPDNEKYDHTIVDNPFLASKTDPLSTFSIDVDTASYSNMRRFLKQNTLPPKEAVRIEELVNYFSYDYPQPVNREPFAMVTEVAPCPWNSETLLAHIGIQGKHVTSGEVPPCNLVFLLDVSGSMNAADKLPLLKTSMGLLVNRLRHIDRIAIVVYAGAAGMVLPSTPGSDKRAILQSLGQLSAGGSTNGGQGIELAYHIAARNYIPGGVNRVILATDGDFNVGVSNHHALVQLIEEKRESGVFLTVLGLGTGNYNGRTMEELSNKGNGNYAYIDNVSEAQKVLVDELQGTLVTIAKDVKIQVEFNPYQVEGYRLIGYENRLLNKEDFNDDTKDAGEIGAGHTVTAIYEIVPKGTSRASVDPLKYQQQPKLSHAAYSDDLFTLKVRYKEPEGYNSKLLTRIVKSPSLQEPHTSNNFRFSAAVAGFGMILRNSPQKGFLDLDLVRKMALSAQGRDPYGYRREFMGLVDIAYTLTQMQ